MSVLNHLEKIRDKLDLIMDVLEELSDNQKKIFAMLSTRSQETFIKEAMNGKDLIFDIPVKKTTTLTWEIEYNGRTYNKFKPCKYKCGGLTSWPEDYKKGDQPLHIHPTDKEILGFSEEGLDGKIHCPLVVKK